MCVPCTWKYAFPDPHRSGVLIETMDKKKGYKWYKTKKQKEPFNFHSTIYLTVLFLTDKTLSIIIPTTQINFKLHHSNFNKKNY